jgi:hypothetical protein
LNSYRPGTGIPDCRRERFSVDTLARRTPVPRLLRPGGPGELPSARAPVPEVVVEALDRQFEDGRGPTSSKNRWNVSRCARRRSARARRSGWVLLVALVRAAVLRGSPRRHTRPFRAHCLSVTSRRGRPPRRWPDQARSHGSGSYQVDAHHPGAGRRDSTAVAVLTIGGGRWSWRASRSSR